MQVGEGAKNQLESGLELGLDTISFDQEIVFTRYVKTILPADGFVYWLKGSLAEDPPLPATITVRCSVHRTINEYQVEDATYGLNRMVVTAQEAVAEFNAISPQEMWIGEFDDVRFGFNATVMRYVQSGIHHYVGDAIYPFMESQIIDTTDQLDALEPVVSNSLPIWMNLTDLGAVYPSFLVADNIRPPYVSVHIDPQGTQAIQALPKLGNRLQHDQLASDRVRVTLYGFTNNSALDYLDYIIGYMSDLEDMGLMNAPIMRDDKRMQTELSVIAMRKTIDFEVSYYQSRVRDIARQLILSCVPTYEIDNLPFVDDILLLQTGWGLLLEDPAFLELNNVGE